MLICLMPFIALANDPSEEEKAANKKVQVEAQDESDAKPVEPMVIEEKTSESEGFSKKSVVSSSAEVELKENETDNTLSKFNYLFYFIYKHKYQDKVLIEQTLEEKL